MGASLSASRSRVPSWPQQDTGKLALQTILERKGSAALGGRKGSVGCRVAPQASARESSTGGGSENGVHTGASENGLAAGDAGAEDYLFAVLGDLHLDPLEMDLFSHGRKQVLQKLKGPDEDIPPHARLFQLGDLGAYNSQPGSSACFKTAKSFLDSFRLPYWLVAGNHDLEGLAEFPTDAANLAAFQRAFDRHHYWVTELLPDGTGPVCIGLSTVRFRDADFSCHEVFIDDEQLQWFQDTLAQYRSRPVFVFTHAPPVGSGVDSIQAVHVKNRCAWLNHSSGNAAVFLDLVQRNPQIRLWFFGHYHLSHDYGHSVSQVGNCLFVQVGVMGLSHRDGRRQSRVVKGDRTGFRMYTLDHTDDEAALRLDASHTFELGKEGDKKASASPFTGQETASPPLTGQIPDPSSSWDVVPPPAADRRSVFKGGALSPVMPPPDWPGWAGHDAVAGVEDGCGTRWHRFANAVLVVHDDMVLQYDPLLGAPMGAVVDKLGGRSMKMIASHTVTRAATTSPQEQTGVASRAQGKGEVASGAQVLSANGIASMAEEANAHSSAGEAILYCSTAVATRGHSVEGQGPEDAAPGGDRRWSARVTGTWKENSREDALEARDWEKARDGKDAIDKEVKLVGVELWSPGSGVSDGRVAVGQGVEQIEENKDGGFWRIYQPNKWRLRQQNVWVPRL